jgi:hypothetical protein
MNTCVVMDVEQLLATVLNQRPRKGDDMSDGTFGTGRIVEGIKQLHFDGPFPEARKLVCASLVYSLQTGDSEILQKVFFEPAAAMALLGAQFDLTDTECDALARCGHQAMKAPSGENLKGIVQMLRIGVDRMDAPA